MQLSAKRSYLVCFGVVLLLDQLDVISSNGHFNEHLKQPFSFVPAPREFSDNLPFVLLGFCLIPVMLQWRKLVKFLGRKLLYKLYQAEHDAFKNEMVKSLVPLIKYDENFWLSFHYTSVTLVEIYVLSNMPIWPPMLTEFSTMSISAPYEELVKEQQENFGLKCVYLVQFTYYFMELVMLIFDASFAARRRKDAGIYLFHHTYTVLLLGISWITVNHRIGLIVLFFHDLPDIFLPIAKCFSYQQHYVRKFCSASTISTTKIIGTIPFVLFVITLIVFRVILFPISIHFLIYKCDFAMTTFSPVDNGENGGGQLLSFDSFVWGTRPHGNAYQVVLIIWLCLLVPLHVFWLGLVIKMIPKLLREDYDDVRSTAADSVEANAPSNI